MNETFQKLWFTPTPSHDKDAMTRKILNITDVVSAIMLYDVCAINKIRIILVFDTTNKLVKQAQFFLGVGM